MGWARKPDQRHPLSATRVHVVPLGSDREALSPTSCAMPSPALIHIVHAAYARRSVPAMPRPVQPRPVPLHHVPPVSAPLEVAAPLLVRAASVSAVPAHWLLPPVCLASHVLLLWTKSPAHRLGLQGSGLSLAQPAPTLGSRVTPPPPVLANMAVPMPPTRANGLLIGPRRPNRLKPLARL
jgi:hypothetical protein